MSRIAEARRTGSRIFRGRAFVRSHSAITASPSDYTERIASQMLRACRRPIPSAVPFDKKDIRHDELNNPGARPGLHPISNVQTAGFLNLHCSYPVAEATAGRAARLLPVRRTSHGCGSINHQATFRPFIDRETSREAGFQGFREAALEWRRAA